MDSSGANSRQIKVPILTRVEGEGALKVVLSGNTIETVELNIYEPPRFFEAFLQGRSYGEVADITSRICGICPIAYQMTAVQAIESAWQVQIPEEIQRLRRLIYLAEWIESHALHIHLLHAPDFFGCSSGIELAKHDPAAVQRGLKIKKIGNHVLEILGGRAIHPINLAVGGFYRLPRLEEMQVLIPQFQWGLEAAIEMTRWIGSFKFPEFQSPTTYIALSHPDEYALMRGDLAASDGTVYPAKDYENIFTEEHVPHSTALHSHRSGDSQPYHVGPLARIHLNHTNLAPEAQRLIQQLNWSLPTYNPYHSILARAIELVHAFSEGLELLQEYRPSAVARQKYRIGSGSGCSSTEAPRGLIYHRYELSDEGLVEFAKIVPPTSQNQRQIELDLRTALPAMLSQSDQWIALNCEKIIRNYDPCISCSTHFLKVQFVGR